MPKAGGSDEEVKVPDQPSAGSKTAAFSAEDLARVFVDAKDSDAAQELMQSSLVSLGIRREVDPLVQLP